MFLIFSIHFQQVHAFVLLEFIFVLRLISLVSRSVFVTKFACANLVAQISAGN